MAMKEKKPGDHLILRLKNNESPLILDWINEQSNLSDAIRFLIEEEIKANAIRDLQEYIPAKRKPLVAVVEHAATVESSSDAVKSSVESEARSKPEVEQMPMKKEEPEIREPEPEPEEQSPEPEKDQPEGPEDVESNTENVPESEPESQEDEGDEYSEEIIDHWMNI